MKQTKMKQPEDETDADDTDSEDIRVAVLPETRFGQSRLIPLQIEDVTEEIRSSGGNHTIGVVQQQPDRGGWTLGNREVNDRYLRDEAGIYPFLAPIASHHHIVFL